MSFLKSINRIFPKFYSVCTSNNKRQQNDEMLSKDSLREKLFGNQVGGPRGTVLELSFEKKHLIPTLQQLFVSCPQR